MINLFFFLLSLSLSFLLEQFVLAIGDSHFRSLVDRYVELPSTDGVAYGVVSFPGISAAQLELEIRHLVLPHIPQVLIFKIILFLFHTSCNLLCCLWVTDFCLWDNNGICLSVSLSVYLGCVHSSHQQQPWR